MEKVDLTTMLEGTLADILVKPKKVLKKKARMGVAAKPTTASKTRQVSKSETSTLEFKINRIEKEIHAKLRHMEEKLTARVNKIEKRISTIEEERSSRSSANMELLKRVHQQAKEEVSSVQGALENMQIAVTKNTTDHEKVASVLDKYKKNRLVTHNFEERLRATEKRLEGLESDLSVPALRYQMSLQPGADRKHDAEKEAALWNAIPPAPPADAAGALSPEILSILKKKIKGCEKGVSAVIEATQEALEDQRAAILFLYKASNIASKSHMSDRELVSIFGKLNSIGGRSTLDDLWS